MTRPHYSPNHARLLEQAGRLPQSPGVYIMKNSAGETLYIGKALNLRSRVRSYFFDAHEDRAQIPLMLRQLDRALS
ncbi:MAG: GIY-YIG nuclease family protein [Chitinispirillaceae bacterium]|nr:GIY-YIG nuclease family protein [Chitinispirillaceae bacterium]